MSDQQLRQLERRFRQTGSLEDEEALFHARLRTGEGVSEERLLVAARAGCEFAARKLGHAHLAGLGWLDRLPTVYEAPCRSREALRKPTLADEVLVRAALSWVRAEQEEPTELSLACLEATEDWLVAPGPGAVRAATNAAGVASESVSRVVEVEPTPPEQRRIARAAVVAWYVADRKSVSSFLAVQVATGAPYMEARRAAGSWRHALRLLCRSTSDDEQQRLEQSVSRDLRAWALGYGDPVRDRVEARRRAGGP